MCSIQEKRKGSPIKRGYQYGFSEQSTALYDQDKRKRKAITMVTILKECADRPLNSMNVLNVGGSTGIIDNYLSDFFGSVTVIDIDEKAIAYAKEKFQKTNLLFEIGDAMHMKYETNSFNVVICAQVYEHVQSAEVLMEEIWRVLKPGGLVYFAAGNRFILVEQHYNLPLLSAIPRPLAHPYLKIFRGKPYYYEKHYSYWGLSKLSAKFKRIDYTRTILNDPVKYKIDYMVSPDTFKHTLAKFISNYFMWLVPTYIWVLKKQ